MGANTQGWVGVHAAKGLLVSTTKRAGTYGSAESTQMDAAEALAQLKSAKDLGMRLSEAAKSAGAQSLASFSDGKSVPKLLELVDPKKEGKHPASVNGQQATKAQGREASSEPVEAFASPLVVLDTPSAALFATEAGIAMFASQDVAVVAQSDVQHTAAHTWSAVSGKTSSWYTHSGGVKAYAANGPVSLRAHTDALQIWADKEVTVISVNDEITITANTKIELIAGQSSVTLEGSNIEFKTPGAFTAKGAVKAFLGGGGEPASVPALPVGKIGETPDDLELHYQYDDLSPVVGAPYKVTFDNGTVRQGTLDVNGYALLSAVPKGTYQVEYGEDSRPWKAPPLEADDAAFAQSKVQADGGAAIERMLKNNPSPGAGVVP